MCLVRTGHTFIAVDRALFDNHGPPIESRDLLRLAPVIAHTRFLFSICRVCIDGNPQDMTA